MAKYAVTPAVKAAIEAGSALITFGAMSIAAIVVTPIAIFSHCQILGETMAFTNEVCFPVPRSFGICPIKMIKPTPLKYPATTGYGIYFINLPPPRRAEII